MVPGSPRRGDARGAQAGQVEQVELADVGATRGFGDETVEMPHMPHTEFFGSSEVS